MLLAGILNNVVQTVQLFWRSLHCVCCVVDSAVLIGSRAAGSNASLIFLMIVLLIMSDILDFARESGCQTHAMACGAGTGVLLLIKVSDISSLLLYFCLDLLDAILSFRKSRMTSTCPFTTENHGITSKICSSGIVAFPIFRRIW